MTKTHLYILSAILILIGAMLYLSQWKYTPYLFATGVAGMTVCNLTVPYKASDYRSRRLQRINILACFAMIIASVFMFKRQMAWIAFLLIASMLQFYTSFVMKDRET